jgi:hypothetical protein
MPIRIGPEGRAALLLVTSVLERHRNQRTAICAAVRDALAPFMLRSARPPTASRQRHAALHAATRPRTTPAPLPVALRRVAPIVTLIAQALAVT